MKTNKRILTAFPAVILMLLVMCFSYSVEAAQSFKVPNYEKFVLNSGLTVYLMEQHEVPLISVSVVLPAGSEKDNTDGKGKYGLASLTADGLMFGTRSYSKKQIEEKLDFLGTSYYSYAGTESAYVGMSFINKDMDSVFPILKEIIVSPGFDAKEFDKKKKRLLMQLEQSKESPSSVMSDYFDKFIFGSHRYGNPGSGFISSVKKITLEDIKSFYKANYKPAESAIAVVGDFKTSRMKERIKKLFDNWKVKGKSVALTSRALPELKENRVLLINKDDAGETRFQIGSFGIKRSNSDYVAVQVVNTVLGGRFTSWLNDELRVNAGLTYGAGSRFNTQKESGTFYISSFTPTATTVQAIDLALEVLERLHTKGIDKKTLESAKNYIKGQFPPRYETANSLARLLTSMFVYGYDESFINNFQANVDTMTVQKAKEIIKKYFPRENLQFVLIGKASEIRDKVKKYGTLSEKEIKADGF
jgi:zinc protease